MEVDKIARWSDACCRTQSYGGHQPGANPSSRPYKSLNSPSAAKISSAARGGIAVPCGARYPSRGGGAPKKAAGENEKYKEHAVRRGGFGTEGAVAQFSMGRRCGNWKCTGRLWSTTGTCTGVTVTPDGTCVSRYDSVHYESCSISEAPSR